MEGTTTIWTILATAAALAGAAAAVYPLLKSDRELAHITLSYRPSLVRVQALGEPVLLTGNWYVRKTGWLSFSTLSSGDVVHVYQDMERTSLDGLRVPATERKQVFLNEDEIQKWVGAKLAECADGQSGDLELALEYRSSTGSAWAKSPIAFCIQK